jgi:tRNA-dihydrouridine synthase B
MEEIVSSVVENVDIPVTAKMRLGWDNSTIKSTKAGLLLEKLGVEAVTLHARTTSQQYTGTSDWKYIKELKDALNIPVIGNGDVKTYSDFKKMKEFTNCDAVMIGRAALGNPWIFKEIIDKKIKATEIKELKKMCIYHVNLLKKNKPLQIAINLSKKHLSYYLKSFNGASEYRKKIMKCNKLEDIIDILNML